MSSRFREDVCTFALAIVKHWLVFLSATIGSGLAAIIGRNYMIPGWAYWLCPSLGLVAASFLAFRDQRRRAEEATLQKIQQKQGFETELAELKKKLNAREDRSVIAATLGGFHNAIELRIREIEQEGGASNIAAYANKYESSFLQNKLDQDSQGLLDEIEEYLSTNVQGASVAMFLNRLNLKFSPRKLGGGLEILQPKFSYKENAIELLKHHANQLMAIIDKYADRRADNA
jgi:hypothetical protein